MHVGHKLAAMLKFLSTNGALVCHVPMRPLSLQYGSVTLAENTPIGTTILEIQATDGDEANTGSSFIIYQMKEGDPNNTFIIETEAESNRGIVKINKVNRWILFFSLSIIYLSHTVTALVLIWGGCWLVVGWGHPKRGTEAPLLDSGRVPVLCSHTPILLPLLCPHHPPLVCCWLLLRKSRFWPMK